MISTVKINRVKINRINPYTTRDEMSREECLDELVKMKEAIEDLQMFVNGNNMLGVRNVLKRMVMQANDWNLN